MNKQEKLKQLKKEVEKLEKKIKNKPIKQIIPEQRLEWGKSSEEDMDWEEAKKWCKRQGKGWRLPTVVELQQAYYDNTPNFGTGYHWSATELSEAYARIVDFSDGSTRNYFKTYSHSVRCVRDL